MQEVKLKRFKVYDLEPRATLGYRTPVFEFLNSPIKNALTISEELSTLN